MKRLQTFTFFLVLYAFIPSALADEDALLVVKKTGEGVVEALEKNRKSLEAEPTSLFPIINQLIIPNFNFDRTSKLIIGRHWKKANQEQQERFIIEFRKLLVHTYGTALLHYRGGGISYEAPRDMGKGRTMVLSKVVLKEGNKLPIKYYLKKDQTEQWKIYDVNIEGISLVINYRNEYNIFLLRHDSNLDALTDLLAERNLKAGAQ